MSKPLFFKSPLSRRRIFFLFSITSYVVQSTSITLLNKGIRENKIHAYHATKGAFRNKENHYPVRDKMLVEMDVIAGMGVPLGTQHFLLYPVPTGRYVTCGCSFFYQHFIPNGMPCVTAI